MQFLWKLWKLQNLRKLENLQKSDLIFGRTVTSHGVKVLCVLKQSRKTFTEYIFIRHKVNIIC